MLTMTPMRPADYERFRQYSAADYADQCRLTGIAALAVSGPEALASLDVLLPQGLATPGHHVMQLEDQDGHHVGVMWFGETLEGDTRSAFLYDLWIVPAWRRCGFAREALQLLHADIRERGISSLSLNVFAHNDAAQALYRDAGYVPSEITMVRTL